MSGRCKPEAAMRAQHYFSDAQNATTLSENTPEHRRKVTVSKMESVSGWEEPKAKKDND